MKASTSLFTGSLEDHLRSAGNPAARRDGETPSVRWDDPHFLEQLDIMVRYEDGSFGRPLVDLRTGKVIERLLEDRR